MMNKVKLLLNEKNVKIIGGAAILLGGIIVGEGVKPFHKIADLNNKMIQSVANKMAKDQDDPIDVDYTEVEEEA